MARSLSYLYFFFASTIFGARSQSGNVHFQIEVHSIQNRGGRCADENACSSGEECCESSTCAITTCQYALYSCGITLKSTLEEKRPIYEAICQDNLVTSSVSVFERNGSIDNSTYTINTFYTDILNDGYRVFIELLHNRSVLIDRFVIDSDEVGQRIGPRIVNGKFELASIQISTIVQCRQGFCGINCNINNDICSCEPGYTGKDCNIEIDDCEGVLCGSTMQCVDMFMTYDCICLPGYTGENCETDIDECLKETCNTRGTCVNDVGSFHCECRPIFTGMTCESKLDRYIVEVTIQSFMNPGGKCADVGGTCANGSGCCDDETCRDTSCDYMFLICRRPRTQISYARSEKRGNCDFIETDSFKSNSEDFYYSSTFITPNPILLRDFTWPIDLEEIYIELIDDDRNASAANNELIDRFVVPVTGYETNINVSGVFNKANIINVSMRIYCSEDYFDSLCKVSARNVRIIGVVSVIIPILLAGLIAVIVTSIWYRRKNHKITQTAKIEESIPNYYERGTGIHHSSLRQHPRSISKIPSHPTFGGLKAVTSSYESVLAGNNPRQKAHGDNGLPGIYSFSPCINGSDYDYESPFWEPSSIKDELFFQLHCLKIPEIESKDLQELELLGSGAFGSVVRGIWIHNNAPNKIIKEEVAVKKNEGRSTESDRINFMKEAAIMGQFNHPNIVRLLGIVVSNELVRLLVK